MEVFRKDLENAGYPALWIKDVAMEDILSTPGIKRFYTLKWCLSKFDQSIEKHLDVQDDMLEAALWEVVTKMTMILPDGKKDREIFEGNGKNADQITFWKKVFHLVYIGQLNEQPCDVNPQINYNNNTDLLKQREPINLIPMELKMASSDLLTNSGQLLGKRQEIRNELERLKAEKDQIRIPSNAAEPSSLANGFTEDLDSKGENMQIGIAEYRNAYASMNQGTVERMDTSVQPSTNNNDEFFGAVSSILAKLTELIDIHRDILRVRDDHLQIMRERNKSLRATLENGENKLKEMRMMVSTLNDLNVQ